MNSKIVIEYGLVYNQKAAEWYIPLGGFLHFNEPR